MMQLEQLGIHTSGSAITLIGLVIRCGRTLILAKELGERFMFRRIFMCQCGRRYYGPPILEKKDAAKGGFHICRR